MKDNKGFIAISLIYSFFLVFLMVLLGIVADYTHNRLLLNNIKKSTQSELNERSEFNPITLPSKIDGYKSGDVVSFVNEKWLVVASDEDTVTLALSRALNNNELTDALSTNNSLLNSNILQNAINTTNNNTVLRCLNIKPSYGDKLESYGDKLENVCYHYGEQVGEYVGYSWEISVVKYVVDYWYSKNALLQRAQAQSGLVAMTDLSLGLDYDPYVRVLTNDDKITLGGTLSGNWWSSDGPASSIDYTTYYEVHPVIKVKIKK